MNWNFTYNPLKKYSEKKLLIFSFAIIIFGIVVNYFFGVCDNNLGENLPVDKKLRLITSLQQIIKLSIVFTLLLILGLAINRKTRIVEIFIIVAISKLPGYIGLTLAYLSGGLKLSAEGYSPVSFSQILISITGLIGFFMLWIGFKNATGIKKWYHVILFISILIFSTVFSKFLIAQFYSLS